MATRLFFLGLIAGLGLVSLPGGTAPAAEELPTERLAQLIGQLGSDHFKERAEAFRSLEAIGPAALELLRQAADSPDMEIKRRSQELVQKIQRRADRERLLAPKHVHLRFDGTPLETAVAEFARKTGYQIVLAGDKSLSKRPITLDTGAVSFWEAFDLFCRKAGLVEVTSQNPPAEFNVRNIAPGMVPGFQPPGNPALPPMLPVIPPPAVPPGRGRIVPPVPAQPIPGLPVAPVPAMPAPGLARAQAIAALEAATLEAAGANSGRLVSIPGRFVLMDGQPKNFTTAYQGAMRIQARSVPAVQPVAHPGTLYLAVEAQAEPKIQLKRVAYLAVEKAVDENDQTLVEAPLEVTASEMIIRVGPNGRRGVRGVVMVPEQPIQSNDGRRQLIRLKAGEKPSRRLKELTGTLSAQVLGPPETLLTVDKVLDAVNTEVKGANGERLQVVEARRGSDGSVSITIVLECPMAAIIPYVGTLPHDDNAGQASSGTCGLLVTDAEGKRIREDIGALPRFAKEGDKTMASYRATFTCRKGRGEPAKVVFLGQRLANIDIPFTLKDVPLER